MTETAEERRARKARERAENAERLRRELEDQYLRPLPERMGFADMQAEHTRLRAKIMEFQGLVIQGKLDVKAAQDLERRMVEQIHLVEEKARASQTGAYVPKPGE
ncbi:MAG TPA: hypothetical protein VHH36_07500 [Candidatus Thermoplasmatota archaeon]|nr:hypothetical protein [Candidatus Thermoplasmatota archaeon]